MTKLMPQRVTWFAPEVATKSSALSDWTKEFFRGPLKPSAEKCELSTLSTTHLTTNWSEPKLSSRAPSLPSTLLHSDSGMNLTTPLLWVVRRTPNLQKRKTKLSTVKNPPRSQKNTTRERKTPKSPPPLSNSSNKVV